MRYFRFGISALLLLGYTSIQAQSSGSDPVKFKREILKFGRKHESTCTSRKVQVVNISEAAITDPGFEIENSSVFSIQSHFRKCPNPLKPGETCRVYVNFCPGFIQDYQARIFFKGSSVYLRMTGEGVGNKF